VKICIGQINTTPGDFDGNRDRMLEGIDQANRSGCDLVVFPELSIPGYLSQDLLYNPSFIKRNFEVIDELCAASKNVSPDLHIVFGYIGQNEGVGKPFTNMAGVINQGKLTTSYQKHLLPFYDVFDELRYFEPGDQLSIFEVKGKRIGLAICEDLWNDKGADDYNYDSNPLERYREAGVDVLLSLNSSPFVHGKCEQRLSNIAPATADGLTIVYVNQNGGQDELVFDGRSFVVRGEQVVYLNNHLFEDSFDVFELDGQHEMIPWPAQDPLVDLLVLGVRDYVRKSGFDQIVLASSGGVDSAVVCKLACDAIGANNVHAIRMPSMFSSDHSRDDARALHENLGCWDYEVPVDHEDQVKMLREHFGVHDDADNLVASGVYNGIADENIQARLRDVYLMHFSNAYGAMPLSTGNKTEAGCGYYTHFDMNFSYAPIKDLYKFQIVEIARSDTRIPENIWLKPPSAELAHGQTDEASLLPYPVLDPIVMAYVEDYVTTFDRFCEWLDKGVRQGIVTSDVAVLDAWRRGDSARSDYGRIVSLIGRMEYKRRQTCPGTKVSKVAFGIGRRIPIVEKWS
jgi:NAD+ synthetase